MKRTAVPNRASAFRPVLFAAVAWAVSLPAAGDESARPTSSQEDKSKYHLFNPTPPNLLREMSTDRPDKTESPYTVDAGHFQFEMDLLNYAHDRERSGGMKTTVDAFAIAPVNFKVGLCNQADLQVVVETWNYVRTKASGPGFNLRQHRRGFGDITTRLKYNFWGNDGGRTAFAAMPFAKLPTNQDELGNNSVEGGLILPLAVELPQGFGMGVMTEFDFNRDSAGDGHHAEFINSITFAHDIAGDLGGYVEFFSAVSSEEDSEWVGTVNLGLTYGLTDNVQLDGGVNIGVTDSAPDINPFIGVSFRF
jgi:outer membrane putative beta-barrel porin/alpha-amylase